jgi:hypothetical protein
MRRSSLTLPILLLGAFVPNLAGATEDAFYLAGFEPPKALSQAAPDCKAGLLPWEAPKASPAAALAPCGCGAFVCQGKPVGTFCFEREFTCQPTGSVCSSNPSTQQCVCSADAL